MSKFSIPYLYNPGVLIGHITPELNEKIKQIVNSPEARSTPYNQRLVSSIKETYKTPHIPELWEYVEEMFLVWKREFCVYVTEYRINDVWTNYMKKHEFNPIHDHSRHFASFVLWVQIPFKSEDEKQYPNYNNPRESCASGTFQFLYPTMTGLLVPHIIHNDKSDEGVIMMFPGAMKHSVYPFYSSDEERISIAGNIAAKGIE